MGRNNGGVAGQAFGWIPLLVLPSIALACGKFLAPWVFMWTLSFALYFSLKWLTWWQARSQTVHSAWRSVAYLLAWPGMDAEAFLNAGEQVSSPPASRWIGPVSKTSLGIILLWVVARRVPQSDALLQGWIGMLGLILILHFGSFEIVALLWQCLGVKAEPIMRAPLRSISLGEFWGKRWNLGFRQFAHELIFRPAYRSVGVGAAGFLVFVASGLIHDMVISIPAQGGYGLPTLYFAIQGLGVRIERSAFGKSLGLAEGVRGWCFMSIFLVTPVFWLFHPWFVSRVILPFMRAIHAL
jgi:alginate O-acetyltransferase complex protein AlgI